MSMQNSDESFAKMLDVMNRIAFAVEKLANQADLKSNPKGPKVSKESMAMVYVATHGVTNTKQIAEQFGVTPRTVRRWSELQALIDGMNTRQSAGEVHRGFHTNNGVEAEEW